ncbi:MAG: 16S rRNA (guanine(527)-N(7))-methyltransferase RsmG [Geobacter sp.]|nr:16S rRNA (guanine(527)-N(7))-methyltransferase RsmG [Geobacter sp.]
MNAAERELLRDGAFQLGIDLDDTCLDRFALLAGELRRWNAKVNLTALKSIRDIVTRHFIDSLTIATLLPHGAHLLDIGSGGGFPCIPLKIARPDLEIVSADGVQKKILFQRHVARLLGFDRFSAVHGRAEALAQTMPRQFSVVVARAVADVETLLRLGLPLLADNGIMIAMKGRQGREEIELAHETISTLGVVVKDVHELRLPVSGDERTLIILGREVDMATIAAENTKIL